MCKRVVAAKGSQQVTIAGTHRECRNSVVHMMQFILLPNFIMCLSLNV